MKVCPVEGCDVSDEDANIGAYCPEHGDALVDENDQFCPNCNAHLGDEYIGDYCTYCGHKL